MSLKGKGSCRRTPACMLARVFLAARHQRLDLQPYLQAGTHRLGDGYAERQLKTDHGTLSYGRAYLLPMQGGCGFHPLDAVLGLTRDHFSPWLMQLVARLATRLSYPATRSVCQCLLGPGRPGRRSGRRRWWRSPGRVWCRPASAAPRRDRWAGVQPP